MTKLFLTLAASTIAGSALAADIVDYPPPEPPVAFVPVFSWTGAYVGAQAGGSFNDGSSNTPSSFVFIPGIAATPGTPAVPGTPGSPAVPAVPGNPGSPGIPGTPGSPGTPGTPAVFGTLEYSCTAAGAGAAGAGACAVEYPDGSTGILTLEQLSATYASAGNAGALGVAGEFQVLVAAATPGTPAVPATPGTPAVPPTEGTPEIPATPGTPGTPAIPGTPGTPDATYAYDFGANTRAYSQDDDSFAGGAHVGYNYAFTPLAGNTFVLGLVGDLSYVDITKGAGITDGLQTIGVTQELDYLATVRLKAGVGLDRFLVYGTGGVAFGQIETSFVNTVFGSSLEDEETRVGYAVGAGTDYALTDNVLLGVEYLYTNLGSSDAGQVIPLTTGATLTTRSDEDFDFHTVWAKASYRFN